jgi:hypothetical protein
LLGREPRGPQKSLLRPAGARRQKKHPPASAALDLAAARGVQLLTEDQYRALQTLGEFDTGTSSWILTPPRIRQLGGAHFCDRRSCAARACLRV